MLKKLGIPRKDGPPCRAAAPPTLLHALLLFGAAEIQVVGPKYLGLVTASLEETRILLLP
jgi:hypothetical protein